MGFLALVLFSNVTFAHAVDFHICQGDLESVAFFGQKASCSKMMEAEMDVPRSCCDLKKDRSGLMFTQKSCCDNNQILQDHLLQKPSVDLDHLVQFSVDFINDFQEFSLSLNEHFTVLAKVEIPPPPILDYRHSQEKLQVFII